MDLRDTSLGFYRAWHAALGVRHGFFLALRDTPLSAPLLASEHGLEARAVRLWCEGAWALSLLTKKGDRYQLGKEHQETLGEPTSPEYLGHHFHYLAQKSLTFGALDDTLQGKKTHLDLANTYAIATKYDHMTSLHSLQVALRRDLAEGIDVLDLGAGHGGWTSAAKREYPLSRFTAADIDLRALHGLEGVKVRHARRLPTAAYDLVHLGEVLASVKDPTILLRTAYRALRPGGRLLAIEGLLPEGPPRDWGPRLILAMGLDFSMDGSRFLSPLALRRSLGEAGFPRATVHDLGGSLFRITARKPQTAART